MDRATLTCTISTISCAAAECNSQATSDMCAVKLKLHLVDLSFTYYTNKFATNSQQIKLMELENNSRLSS